MNFNSLFLKLTLGYFSSIAILAVVLGLTLNRASEVKSHSVNIFNHQVPGVTEGLKVQSEVNSSLSALKGWVNLGEKRYPEERRGAWKGIDRAFNNLALALRENQDSYIDGYLFELQADLKQLRTYQNDIEAIAHTPENNPGLKMLIDEATPRANQIISLASRMIELESKRVSTGDRQALFIDLVEFRHSMTSSLASVRAFMITNDNAFLKSFNDNWQNNENSLSDILGAKNKLSKEQVALIKRIQVYRDEFILYPDQMFDLREGPDWDVAKLRMDKWVAPLADKIKHAISAIVELQTSDMESSFLNIEEEFNSLIIVGVFLLLASIAICILLVILTIKIIIGPINKVVNVANRVASGDFSEDITISGSTEIEKLGHSLSNMTQVLRKIASQANRVSKGEYGYIYQPQSEKDILGISLKSMTENLRDATQTTERENWVKSGQAEFSELLRGLDNEDEIAEASIGFIAKYLDAFVGAFYLRKEEMLFFTSGYSIRQDRNMRKRISVGEGILGRAVLEQKINCVEELPSPFFNYGINTGVGETEPNTLITVPILNPLSEKPVALGAFVLGTSRTLELVEKELLEKLAGTLAASIESAQSKNKLQELIEEYQQQAEELQAQQEELKAANEELAEQAEALRLSEEELTLQSKKMQKNNELLELQKKEQEDKNKLLIEAKNIIETKAHDLESASKYKTEFLANMSHELRTPLNSLLILSESLSQNKKGNLSDSQVEDARVIYDGGLALLNLINDILDLSKVEAGKLKIHQEECNITYLCERIKEQFLPVANLQSVDFIISVAKDIPEVLMTDIQRLEQIIRNFLSNAFKFTPTGTVTLSIEKISTSGKSLIVNTELEDGIVFTVKDSGIGISKNQRSEIFEAFHQGDGSASRRYGGTGLGLTISRELSKLLGGEIQLDSKLGKGSQFSLLLPFKLSQQIQQVNQPNILKDSVKDTNLEVKSAKMTIDNRLDELTTIPGEDSLNVAKPEDKPSIKANLSEAQGQGSNVTRIEPDTAVQDKSSTILIIEDDNGFAKILKNLAEEKGYSAITTQSGEKGVQLASELKPSAIILDIGLPDINGVEVLERLKNNPDTKSIPVHIVSGDDSQFNIIRQATIGILTKPASIQQLEKMLLKFETINQQRLKKVLVVCNNDDAREVENTIASMSLEITNVVQGKDSFVQLKEMDFDCVIINFELEDISIVEWFEYFRIEKDTTLPPTLVICHSQIEKSLYNTLMQYTHHVVIKGDYSKDRIKDTVNLFLHRITKKSFIKKTPDSTLTNEGELGGKKIMLVDDDLRNSYALSKVLKEHDLDVVLADNGELALEKLKAEPNIELILMDIMMPVMDGYETIKRVRHSYSKTLPIIALTAKAMSSDKEKCISVGANDYMAKPVNTEQLVNMVKVWMYR